MKGYLCTHCNFRLNSNNKPRDCPYCGRDSLEMEKSAEEILDDVNELLKE